ncbi:hypothetical protein L1987_51527 [Smallanthus sonchifolius]|uniref:Uncharacterized protein n=1 Tax=Smallanthus sonchifolius TaxID=185202 RepID=A0ACB9EQK1_9ASTR|nr:hypothetical protein L1987_51527 [Smallanthus sonchifolius]
MASRLGNLAEVALIEVADSTCLFSESWLPGKDEDSQMAFMRRWMWSHFNDSRTILKKPLVLAEFGRSSKDPNYNINKRDSYMKSIYSNIYMDARHGGAVAGGLVWQLQADGMGSYGDGYEIILSNNPSTNHIISQQSHAMTTLSHLLRIRGHHHANHTHI